MYKITQNFFLKKARLAKKQECMYYTHAHNYVYYTNIIITVSGCIKGSD